MENDRKAKVIVSTVGTSLITNFLDPDERQKWAGRLNASANLREDKVDPEIKEFIDSSVRSVCEKLKNGDVNDRRRRSAELNGIYGIYGGYFPEGARQDIHYLVKTDTYQGSLTANLLKDFLIHEGFAAEVVNTKDLNTSSTKEFNSGIRDLIHWCHTTLVPFKDSGYRIYFNLVGGFKALQGYMNTIGMFYADRLYYIFEGSNNMINIPKLPIKIDINALKPHVALLAMMSESYVCREHEVQGLSRVFFDSDGKDVILSPSGELMWDQVKEDVFVEDLLVFPNIKYSDEFKRNFQKAQKWEKIALQETLAKVACLLAESGGDLSALKGDHGLRLEKYQDRYEVRLEENSKAARPISKFRVNNDMRVTCVKEGKSLVMRKFDHHKVNDNP